MIFRVRPRDLRRRLYGVAVVAGLVGWGIGAAAHADASPVTDYTVANAPRVCATLTQYPTFPGVTATMQAVIDESGFTVEQAAQVVVSSVWNLCPQHKGLLLAYGEAGRKGRAI